ncbi:hypothetical protein LguiA_024086 [Lonicera macranthoides]
MPTPQTSIEFPVFDISQPLSQSSFSSLYLACKEWGFFHITNHGVSKELYRKLHSISTHVFHLPPKRKINARPSSTIKTYTPPFIASPFFESLRVSGSKFYAPAEKSAQILFNHPNAEFR